MANKALLVGINAYPSAPLAGCLSDISTMADVITSKFGFEDSEVRLLADGRATTDSIVERLQWLVTGLSAGDRCYFHFSGHGIQVATRDFTNEVDGLDECICPFDFDWSAEHMINDKFFVSIFSKIPPGVKFNWSSDSCHSGDLTRDLDKLVKIPRTIPVPVDLAWRKRVAKDKKIQVNREMITGQLNVGFISACQSSQTASDTVLMGNNCGAFTYFFSKELKKAAKTTPLTTVVDETKKQLAKAGFKQVPQVEGSRSTKPFLG